MTRTEIVACLVTIGVAVPAGWRALDADIPGDGPRIRPELQTFAVGDASVTMQLDRGAILGGGTISATLVATSDRARDVAVAVDAFENEGWGAERVPNPPTHVGKRTLKLHAAPGGGPPQVATFTVGKVLPKGYAGWFYLVASSTRRGDSADARSARAGFVVWGGNELGMSIDAPAAVPAMGAFTIAIHVKNTTKRALASISATVGSRTAEPDMGGVGPQIFDGEAFTVEAVERADDRDRDDDEPLAPGAERVLRYRIVPKNPEVTEFTVIAEVTGDTRGADSEFTTRYTAMDMRTFVRPAPGDEPKPTAPPVAAR